MSFISYLLLPITLLLQILYYPYLYLLKPILDKILHKLTISIFENQIVFNCAWEDPHIDKQALDLEKDKDSILIITSAGCNILSLALESPKHIYSIDKNPCQNAVLELKISAIRELDYETFWKMWGTGKLENFTKLWYPLLRQHLSLSARQFWDTHSHYFDGKHVLGRNSYYYKGPAGVLAWVTIKLFFKLIPGLNSALQELIHAPTLEQQREIYFSKVQKRLFNPVVMWLFSSSSTLALLNGVPEAQRKLLEEQAGTATIGDFIKASLETVMSEIPLKNNHFWRVYLEDGAYTKDCCPDYLVEENFYKLKKGLVDRISIHTETIEEFLSTHKERDVTRFILLDHMDWMAQNPKALSGEWQQILDHSAPGRTKYLWRSASLKPDFVLETAVKHKGKDTTLGELVTLDTELTERLHKLDRVHTYTSFWVANPK